MVAARAAAAAARTILPLAASYPPAFRICGTSLPETALPLCASMSPSERSASLPNKGSSNGGDPSPPRQSYPDSVALVWRVRRRDGRSRIRLETHNALSPSPQLSPAADPPSVEPRDLSPGTGTPEAVLQYERQRRKAQHAQKVGRPLDWEDLRRRVVHADNCLVVVDKPPGVLTVPGIKAHPSLLGAVHGAYGPPNIEDPAHMIVHRLDMDTSGLVAFGRTLDVTRHLHASFRGDRGHTAVYKEYTALVVGQWPSGAESGIVELPLQRDHAHPPFMRASTPQSEEDACRALVHLRNHGYRKLVRKPPKPSATEFHVLERFDAHPITGLPCTRLLLRPLTGRTHQLRVHCAALGYPIVGDPAYGWLGEAHPNGGLSEVASFFAWNEAEDDNDEPNRKKSEGREPQPLPIVEWELVPLCPDELQAQWADKYPPNHQPMCLHASLLRLPHPTTGQTVEFRSDPSF